MHEASQGECGKLLEGQESAAAAELAASAAHLRLLMQKLIAARTQGHQQDQALKSRSNLDDVTDSTTMVVEACLQHNTHPTAAASSPTAVQKRDVPVCGSPKAIQQTALTAPSSPGMAALAAQARDLLREIEAAAASSPCSSCQAFPEQLPTAETQQPATCTAAVRRQLPFVAPPTASTAEAHQSCLSSMSQAMPATAAAATGLGMMHRSTAADGYPGVMAAEPECSMSLADSHTWSKALQLYQLHQQQAGLVPQLPHQQIPHSCASSIMPSIIADSMTSCPSQPATAVAADATAYTPLVGTSLTKQPADSDQQQPGSCTGSTAAASSAALLLGLTSNRNNTVINAPAAVSTAAGDQLSCMQSADNNSMAAVSPAIPLAAGINPEVHSRLTCDSSRRIDKASAADGVRLRVKALRGPLEDAMRCFTQLQEAQEEAAQLRAHNSRLAAEAQCWQAERSYFLAERKLHSAHLRHLAVQLADNNESTEQTATEGSKLLTAKKEFAEAEHQLQAYWHLLPLDSELKTTALSPALADAPTAEKSQLQVAVKRKQQQVSELASKLQDTQGQLLQQQKRSEHLQQQLAAHVQAAEIAKLQEVAAVQAKGEKKLLKAEHKLLKLAQMHRAVVAKFQQQLQEQQDQVSTAEQQRQLLQAEQQVLQQRMKQLEDQKAKTERDLQDEKQKRSRVEQQLSSLQHEQRELLSAISALEASLTTAQTAVREQTELREKMETAVQAKTAAVATAKQELREMKLTAQATHLEIQQLHQQLSNLKTKLAESARQLSAARTAAQEAQQELTAEQRRSSQQDILLEECKSELEKARRVAAAAQKAQAAEVKRAAATESAAVSELQEELTASQEAATEAQTALSYTKKQLLELQHEHELLQQQCITLQQQAADSKAELQKTVNEYESLLVDMHRRAEAAEADLTGIRQDVASWVALRSQGQPHTASPAEHHPAASDMQRELDICTGDRSQSAAATSKYLPAAEQSARLVSDQLHVHQQQHQAQQLERQAMEVLKLQQQLQDQLQDTQQQLSSSQAELLRTRQQLAAAEEALAWQEQLKQQQLSRQDEAAELPEAPHQQHLHLELSAAEGRIAELTLEVAAAKAEVVQQQRKDAAAVQQLQEQLQLAEYARVQAQQQLQQLQEEFDQQQEYLVALQQRQSTSAASAGVADECKSSSSSSSSSDCESETEALCSGADLIAAQQHSFTSGLQSGPEHAGKLSRDFAMIESQLAYSRSVEHAATAVDSSNLLKRMPKAVGIAASDGLSAFDGVDRWLGNQCSGCLSSIDMNADDSSPQPQRITTGTASIQGDRHISGVSHENGDVLMVAPASTNHSGRQCLDGLPHINQQTLDSARCSSYSDMLALQSADPPSAHDLLHEFDGTAVLEVHPCATQSSPHQNSKQQQQQRFAAQDGNNSTEQQALAMAGSAWDVLTSGSVDYDGVMAAATAALKAAAAGAT